MKPVACLVCHNGSHFFQQHQGVLSKTCSHADFDSKGISQRIVDRVPSIGRGQILTSEDAPARIDAGIELDLGLGGSEKRRSWPEQPDSVHNKAGVHRSQPGDGSRAPGELYSAGVLKSNCIHSLYKRSSRISAWGAPRRDDPGSRKWMRCGKARMHSSQLGDGSCAPGEHSCCPCQNSSGCVRDDQEL